MVCNVQKKKQKKKQQQQKNNNNKQEVTKVVSLVQNVWKCTKSNKSLVTNRK